MIDLDTNEGLEGLRRLFEDSVIEFPAYSVRPRTAKGLWDNLKPQDCPQSLKEWFGSRHAHGAPGLNKFI
jgi:hypothetical protein